MPRRLQAILFTDIAGYSTLTHANEPSALSALEEHNRLLREAFAQFHGREVKTVGDAFLVTFASALEAVDCAAEVQHRLHREGAVSADGAPLRIRVGLHVGDVLEERGDVLGDAVNIAARIVRQAEPGGICVSQQVVDQVSGKSPHAFLKQPPVALKGIPGRTTLYRMVPVWASPAAVERRPSDAPGRQIAVLPLANISPDPGDGYFADGLTEELIATLAQIRGLQVTARSSVIPYKAAPKPIPEIASDLGVDSVLEGSVRKAGNRIRITLQLVDAATQKHVWSSRYDRVLDDVFAVQTDIAEQTAKALRLELELPRTRVGATRAAPNPRWGVVTTGVAFDHYLRGLVAANDHSAHRTDEAIRCFEQATVLDPTFAEAFAAWSNVYVTAAGDSIPMREAIPKARTLAERALALDPDSSGAHAALGNIALQYDNDWARSESEFARAIELNPSNLTAYQFYGLLLMTLGRFEEAKAVFGRAALLDPSGHHRGAVAWAEVESGNFDAGLRLAEAMESNHAGAAHHRVGLGFLCLEAGQRQRALACADVPLPPDADDDHAFDHALLNALLGRPDGARRRLAAAQEGRSGSYTSATHLAMLWSALGETSRALDLLEKDHREGDRVLWLYYRGVYFDPIRNEPRFVALLRELGLPTQVKRGPSRASPDPGRPSKGKPRARRAISG